MLAQIPSARRGTGYWIASGHLQFRLGNYGEAQAAFGKAVANDPNNTESLLRLALALRFDESRKSSDAWDAPRDLCKRVIQLDPTNVPAYVIRGVCATYGVDKEISDFKTAVALDPEDFSAQYNLGVAMLRKRNRDAWKPLQEALKLEEKVNLDDYLIREPTGPRGTGHSLVTHPTVSSLTTLPTTKSLHVPIKLALAKAYGVSDQYERGIREYKEVLALEPKNPVAPYGLSTAYWNRSNKDDEDPDYVYWRSRTNKKSILAAVIPSNYMPVVVKIAGMLR
jgi:tetratricopeptide (TPR) repeat protein